MRIPFVHGCRLITPARVRGGLVCNLSTHGAFVTLDEPLPETGEAVQIVIAPPGQDPLVEADAVIASQNRQTPLGPDSMPPGVGLRFVSLGGVYEARIEALLRQYHEGRGHLVLASPPHAGPRRIPYIEHCRLTLARGTIDTVICNLSRLGAYVAVEPRPAVGEELGLSFVTLERFQLDLRGVVSWLGPEPSNGSLLPAGCGIRFTSVSKLDDLRIRSLVETSARRRRRG